jgi:hypothetical protein
VEGHSLRRWRGTATSVSRQGGKSTGTPAMSWTDAGEMYPGRVESWMNSDDWSRSRG